jgi:hypothetical protein
MAWTYDLDALGDTEAEEYPLFVTRFLIGDTIQTDQQLQDEEILVLLDLGHSPQTVAIMLARSLAARYARYADKWVGDLKILASQRFKHYTELVGMLTTQGALIGRPSAGGVYVSDKESYEANSSLVQGSFKRGMDDNTTD